MAAILRTLEPIISAETFLQVQRIYTEGSLSFCNARSSDSNLHVAVAYGNHPSLLQDIDKTSQATIKDAAPGLFPSSTATSSCSATTPMCCPLA
jgi:hypothetical protein